MALHDSLLPPPNKRRIDFFKARISPVHFYLNCINLNKTQIKLTVSKTYMVWKILT